MEPNLQPIVAALTDLTDVELYALIASANDATQAAPGLLAWLEHACDWELRQREDVEFPLRPPEDAIDPVEDGVSLAAATMLRERFLEDAPAVAALFAAIGAVLTGRTR